MSTTILSFFEFFLIMLIFILIMQCYLFSSKQFTNTFFSIILKLSKDKMSWIKRKRGCVTILFSHLKNKTSWIVSFNLESMIPPEGRARFSYSFYAFLLSIIVIITSITTRITKYSMLSSVTQPFYHESVKVSSNPPNAALLCPKQVYNNYFNISN